MSGPRSFKLKLQYVGSIDEGNLEESIGIEPSNEQTTESEIINFESHEDEKGKVIVYNKKKHISAFPLPLMPDRWLNLISTAMQAPPESTPRDKEIQPSTSSEEIQISPSSGEIQISSGNEEIQMSPTTNLPTTNNESQLDITLTSNDMQLTPNIDDDIQLPPDETHEYIDIQKQSPEDNDKVDQSDIITVTIHNDDDINQQQATTDDSQNYKDDEPVQVSQLGLSPRMRKRVENVLQDVVESIDEDKFFEDEDQIASKKIKCRNICCEPDLTCCHWPGTIDVTPMSPKLYRTFSQSTKITKKMMFPAMPKIVRDVWVFLELSITLFQLIFSLINIQFTTNRTYNGFYISLSSINTLLACFDAFTYYYQLGSCKMCFKKVKKKTRASKISNNDNETQVSCKTKYLNLLKTWLEIFRSVISELLIYPLVILDLFELLGENTFNVADSSQTITFVLFVVSSLYFVLNVYVVRMIMLGTTISTFKKIATATKHSSQNIDLLIRFLVHVIGQIIAHFLCIIAVGIKIQQENNIPHQGNYRVTPFLWLAVLSGWIIPLMGTAGFFILNYYWVQMFSIGLFMDMMSLIEGQSFGQVVIRGKTKISQEAHEKSEKILQKIEYTKVKKEYVERNEANLLAKLLYPLKVPVFIIYAVFYNIILIGFCTSLILTTDINGTVQSAVTNTDTTSTMLLLVIALLFTANLHLVLITNLWFCTCVLFAFVMLLLPSLAFVSGPIMCVIVLIYQCVSKKRQS